MLGASWPNAARVGSDYDEPLRRVVVATRDRIATPVTPSLVTPQAYTPPEQMGKLNSIGKKAFVACKTAPKPKATKSSKARTKKFDAEVKQLSVRDLSEIIQIEPLKRIVKSSLTHGVERCGSEAFVMLMESACDYIHEIYNDSFVVTSHSGKRKCLMVRDVMATVHAKGSSIVAP